MIYFKESNRFYKFIGDECVTYVLSGFSFNKEI